MIKYFTKKNTRTCLWHFWTSGFPYHSHHLHSKKPWTSSIQPPPSIWHVFLLDLSLKWIRLRVRKRGLEGTTSLGPQVGEKILPILVTFFGMMNMVNLFERLEMVTSKLEHIILLVTLGCFLLVTLESKVAMGDLEKWKNRQGHLKIRWCMVNGVSWFPYYVVGDVYIYNIITQLAVYTTYIPLIYCQSGDDMLPTTYYGKQETPLINKSL